MQILNINSMRWLNPEKTLIGLNADTEDGDSQEISTPYSAESIIWDAVQAFPQNEIAEYVVPVIVEPVDTITDVEVK